MATKTEDARTKSSEDAQKRTRVRDLPKPERKLDPKEIKKVKGGTVGPCYRERRDR